MASPASSLQRLSLRSLSLIAVLLSLMRVAPALAEYLGPDRTVVETKRVRDPKNDVWTLIHVDPDDGYKDTCLIVHTCAEHPSTQRQQALCGWIADNATCEKAYRWKKVTIELPEATIQGTLHDCAPVAGWCSQAAVLHLTALEPLEGESILAIEGVRSGESFACQGVLCDVALLEGANSFSYWAISSFGDSSRMGELSARLDSRPPDLSGEVSGTPGEAGWWISGVVVTAQAADPEPGSGLAAVEASVDGGDLFPVGAGLTLGDGVHDVLLQARDQVGHTTTAEQTVMVDTQPPGLSGELSGELSGAPGEAGWWISGVVVAAQAADPEPGSGVAEVEASVDGGDWIPVGAGVPLGDGVHDVLLRAHDLAGHSSQEQLTVPVDGQAPDASFINPADDGWVSGVVSLQGLGRDGISGLAQATLSLGAGETLDLAPDANGFWVHSWDTTAVPDGEYELLLQVEDQAGNPGQAHLTLKVDNSPPRARLPDSWPIWEEVTIRASDRGSGLKRVRLILHGGELGDRSYRWRPVELPVKFRWDRRIDGKVASIGAYWVILEVFDEVGNRRVARGQILIPTPDPLPSPTPPVVAPPASPTAVGLHYTPPTLEAPSPTPLRVVAAQPSATLPVLALQFEAQAPDVKEPSAPPSTSTPLWGPAAVALAGTAAAFALSRRRKRKAEQAARLRRAAWENSPAYRQERLQRLRREAQARAAAIRAQMRSAPETARQMLDAQKRVALEALTRLQAGAQDPAPEPPPDLRQLDRMEAVTRRRDFFRWAPYAIPADAERLRRMERRAERDFEPPVKVVQPDEELCTTYQVESLYGSGGLGPSLPLPVPGRGRKSTGERTSRPPSLASPVPPWGAPVSAPSSIHYGSVDDLSPVPNVYGASGLQRTEIDESSIKDVAKLLKVGKTVYKIEMARPIEYVLTESDQVIVRVSDLVPVGSKTAYRVDLDIPGTRYKPSTITNLTASKLVNSSISNAGLAVPMLTSLGANLFEFGVGKSSDIGIWSNEFLASTLVDIMISGGVGVASALIVGGAISLAVLGGLTAAATIPIWGTVAITAGIASAIGALLDVAVDVDGLKGKVTRGFSSFGQSIEYIKVILNRNRG
jgi:hypothetical protein